MRYWEVMRLRDLVRALKADETPDARLLATCERVIEEEIRIKNRAGERSSERFRKLIADELAKWQE